MSYRHYDIEDFASDPKFREWVLSPGPSINFFWEKWLLSHPEQKETIEKARLLVKTYRFDEAGYSEGEKHSLLAKINQAIEANTPPEQSKVRTLNIDHQKIPAPSHTKRSRMRQLAVAAVLAGVVAAAAFFIQYDVNKDGISDENEVVYIEKESPIGRRTLTLPDGSVVVLNAKTTISFPSAFAGHIREVRLSGEAFFEVVEDSIRPFLVITDDISTQVLGTSFSVNAYPHASKASVCLVSGKVLVRKNETEELVLAPGEAARLDRNTGEMVKKHFDYMQEITWKDGTLYFKETPMEEVLEKLEQWYGVTFLYDQIPKKVKPISGGFTNEYLSNVLQSLSYTIGFDYEINGKEVTLWFRQK